MTTPFPTITPNSILPVSASAPMSPGANKPELPKRSHRRSLVGDARSQTALQPSQPASPSLHQTALPSITASSSMSCIPQKSSPLLQQEYRRKRASTGAFPTATPHVAPLNIASKKGTRPSIINSAALPSSTNSPVHAMTTPTMPAKSRFRLSLDSPGSLSHTSPIAARSSVSMSPTTANFVHGIGLEFGSPEPPFLSCSSSFASRMTQDRSSSYAMDLQLASELTRTISNASSGTKDGVEAASDPCVEEDRSDTSRSSVATSVPDKAELTLPLHAKSHDAVFSHAPFDYDRVAPPKRASLLSAIPMGISRSHQDFIDDSPTMFQRTEAEGLFNSVRGLMADLRLDIGQDPSRDAETAGGPTANRTREEARENAQVEDSIKLRSWLADPQRSQERSNERSQTEVAQDVSTPNIRVAVTPTSPQPTSSGENTFDTTEVSVKRTTKPTLEPGDPTLPTAAEDSTGGTSPRVRGLWGLLRAPSSSSKPAASTRSPSASSYSSITSFVDPSPSPTPTNEGSTSSLFSNSSFSILGRKLITRSVSDTRVCTTPQHDDDLRLRLARREVDEDKLANLIISCADARHILKTDTSPAKLKEVGLKLELGWREQLAEAQQLRNRLEITQDTVEDLEDENKHLRSQLGGLSEQIVSREEDMKRLSEATELQIGRERQAVEAEMKAVKAEVGVKVAELGRRLAEEKAFALGLGMMLSEQVQHGSEVFGTDLFGATMEQDYRSSRDNAIRGAPGTSRHSSGVFDDSNDAEVVGVHSTGKVSEHLRRSALLQARPNRAELADDVLGTAYDELFHCAAHRFAHGAAAPPSTLVDERVLLIGTDHRLLLALAQKLFGLGLRHVLWATPAWGSPRPNRASGLPRISFDPNEENAWTMLVNKARNTFGGDLDCVVNAFDQLDAERLAAVSSLLRQQANVSSVETTAQPISIVSVVYDPPQQDLDNDGVNTSMYTMAMIGLTRSLALQNNGLPRSTSSRAVRWNTVVLPQPSSSTSSALDAILRLLDPCSSVQGCVVHPSSSSSSTEQLRCVGPPLCPALPGLYTSPRLSQSHHPAQAPSSLFATMADHPQRQRWLRTHKRIADIELLDALQAENQALKNRVHALEKRASQQL